jgi:type I restriction enzyme S subunit
MWEGSDGIRFLRVDNLTFDGELDLEASRFRISTTTHTGALARSRCFPGDVLMNIVGPPLGKLGLVRPEFGDVNVNQAVAIFRPKPPLRSEYLLLWLTHDASQRWLRRNAKQTSGRVNLTLEMCKTLPLGQPRDSEQKEIVGRMAGIRGRLDTERMTCSKLRLLKQGLMEDLLTGRVRVTNLLGEAAA